jgi:hypothetical protein
MSKKYLGVIGVLIINLFLMLCVDTLSSHGATDTPSYISAQLRGKWQLIGDPQQTLIFSDNQVMAEAPKSDIIYMPGTWSYHGNGRVKIIFPVIHPMLKSVEVKLTLQGDKLILHKEDGKIREFEKVKS